MEVLETTDQLQAAVNRLVAIEPRFDGVVERHGLPSLRKTEPGLKSLLRIVTEQLISLKAGKAIWGRLEARLGDFQEDAVLHCPEEDLRALGLSGAKAGTFHAAAQSFRHFGDDKLGRMSNQDVLKLLTSIRGIGPWTAEIYLLSAMMRIDAWPAGDLALQVAARHLLEKTESPSPKVMIVLAEPWRPVRAVAARLLWAHYRGLKGMDQHDI